MTMMTLSRTILFRRTEWVTTMGVSNRWNLNSSSNRSSSNNKVSWRFRLPRNLVTLKKTGMGSRNYSEGGRRVIGGGGSSTIYAIATGISSKVTGVAVVRVSGDEAREVLRYMTVPLKPTGYIPPPTELKGDVKLSHGKLVLRRIVHPLTRELLDIGLVVPFLGPNSFTGEDIVELHVHGGVAVLRGILEGLEALNLTPSPYRQTRASVTRFRLALPGEFTKRAFENDKLDLTAVEGLADLLNSETSAQRRLALRHTQGEVGQLYTEWREKLISSRGQIEAIIDFGEDEEIEPDSLLRARSTVTDILNSVTLHLKDQRRGEILMSGIKVALLGSPNAGKSSFLNCLTRRDTAIVSPIPGTTRDIITGKLDLGGMPLVVLDTAGIRKQSKDVIEQEGVRRALLAGKEADICLLILDGERLIQDRNQYADLFHSLSSDTIALFSTLNFHEKLPWIVINKCERFSTEQVTDLVSAVSQTLPSRFSWSDSYRPRVTPLSCLTGLGWEEFNESFITALKVRFESDATEPAAITHARHRHHLQETAIQLTHFLALTTPSTTSDPSPDLDLVLAAEHLRLAAHALGQITGQIDVEEILDLLFRTFCIGK